MCQDCPNVLLFKIIEFVISLGVIIPYRIGRLDISLLNESPDVAILASGVFVGYLLYTAAWLASYRFTSDDERNTLLDIVIGSVAVLLWLSLGIIILQRYTLRGRGGMGHWGHHGNYYFSNDRAYGLAVGSLSIILAAVYLLESIFCTIQYVRKKLQAE